MSERPFMQLYVSDFVGDTLHLSTEQIGAYMLLLMAMWNAGGKLPADDAKLARVVRMTVKKWRSISADLMAFFDGDETSIRHKRLTKELQKSESKSALRASAGSRGGTAKALKDKGGPVAIATDLPQHLPDTRYQTKIEPIAQQPIAARRDFLFDKICDAVGADPSRPPPWALDLREVNALIDKGYDLDRDILPVFAAKNRPGISNVRYFTRIIIDEAQKRAAIPQAPSAPKIDWAARLDVFYNSDTWASSWGPKPTERGCEAPAHLIRDRAA